MTHEEAVDHLLIDARFVPLCLWVSAKYRAHHDAYPTWAQLRQYLLDGGMTYDNIFVQEHTRRRRERQPYQTYLYRRAYRRAVDGWAKY